MAILRCNSCDYLREVSNEYVGKIAKCPVCEKAAPIHDTVAYVKNLIAIHHELLSKYDQLNQPVADNLPNYPVKHGQELDLHNTDAMTNSMQYQPIIHWFERQNIKVEVNHQALDTQGFYDEIAVEIGDNYELLQDLIDKIRKAQRNNYSSVILSISDYSQNQIKIITSFCKNLYDFSFLTKYYYNKNEKKAHLTLQSIPNVVRFFNGEWLEWYVFMKILKYCYDSHGLFSCLRNFNIQFANDDQYEVDIFFLLNSKVPLFIECKSGEFRSFIEKYSKMRKRLNIDPKYFLLLTLGVSDEQVAGLNKMYDITFVNEKNFIAHITSLLKT